MTTNSKLKLQTPPPGQYLALQLRAKESVDGGPLVITGVANDANTTDSYGTRIKVSQRALDAFMENPILLMNHDVHNPIGTVRSINYVNGQLRAEAEIHPDAKTLTGASITDLVRSKVLRAFSVRIDECTETRQKDYTQLDADVLDELSVVTLPSNRPSLFQMRTKGVQIHGAEELIDLMRSQKRSKAGFKVGDRVEVKPASAHTMGGVTMGGAGTVEEIGTLALGIRLDDMPDEIHKWYVADELEAGDTDVDTSEGMGMERSATDLRKPDQTRAAGPLSLDLLQQRLSKLISATKSDDYWSYAYLVAVYDDYCVWCEYNEGDYYRQGYAVDAAGEVMLIGTEQEVLPQWVVVGGADDEGTEERSQHSPSVQTRAAEPERLLTARLDSLEAELRRLSGLLEPSEQRPAAPLTPTLDDVRTALRSVAQSVTGAQTG